MGDGNRCFAIIMIVVILCIISNIGGNRVAGDLKFIPDLPSYFTLGTIIEITNQPIPVGTTTDGGQQWITIIRPDPYNNPKKLKVFGTNNRIPTRYVCHSDRH